MHPLPTIGLAPWWRRALIVLGGIAAAWLLSAGVANADDSEPLFGEADGAGSTLFGDLGSGDSDGDARIAADRAAEVLDDARTQVHTTVVEVAAPVVEITESLVNPMTGGLIGPLPTVDGTPLSVGQATPARATQIAHHGTGPVVGAVAPDPVEMPGSPIVTDSADLSPSAATETASAPAPDAPRESGLPVRSAPPAVPGSAIHGGVDGGSLVPGTPAVSSGTVARTATSVDPTIVRELPNGARAAQPGVRPD